MSAVLIDISCFIHEIPLGIYRMVCIQLDQNERWKQLADVIGYDRFEIEKISQSNSPSTKLLSQWSEKNHTVAELFMALHKINEIRIMEHLLGLVDGMYHGLIGNSSKPSSKSSSMSSTKSHNSEIVKMRHHKKSVLHIFKKNLISSEQSSFSGIPKISFNELTTATDEWSAAKLLDTGSYGSVYRGNWKCTEVAVKRFNCHGFDKSETVRKQLKQIVIEMRFLNRHRHDNILPLYGYSFDGSSACLVYQLMVNGSLDRRLQNTKLRLTYKQRLDIAIGTARGLQFLHSFNEIPTVHGDIKSANILLDANLQPKIGDFGLARQANGTKKSKVIYGTRPYMADDFFENLIISPKNDTFSFGVVLFELGTGLPAYDEQRGIFDLLTYYMGQYRGASKLETIEITDATERKHSPEAATGTLFELIKIGFSCTKSRSIDRPEMLDVLNSLLDIV